MTRSLCLAGSLSLARAIVGALRLAWPAATTPGISGKGLGRPGRRIVRVLGARQLTQAVVTGLAPNGALLWSGAAVDILHALSMIGLVVGARRYRRPAMVEAILAASFAAAGAAAASGRGLPRGERSPA
jgi:hypothetical protein